MYQLTIDAKWGLAEHAIVVLCRNQREAMSRVKSEFQHWADVAALFGKPKTEIDYGGRRRYEIPASRRAAIENVEKITSFGLYTIQPFPLTVGVSNALIKIAESPDDQWFLHRLSPDLSRMKQIAVSEGARSLIVGATTQQAVNRNRSDYMLMADLEEMRRVFRQDLSVGSTIQHSFRLFSPVTKGDWRQVWYDYQIVDLLPDGDLIQLGRCRGVQPIAAPVGVR